MSPSKLATLKAAVIVDLSLSPVYHQLMVFDSCYSIKHATCLVFFCFIIPVSEGAQDWRLKIWIWPGRIKVYMRDIEGGVQRACVGKCVSL